jgi:D-3-phosphoglycerate dehydrogenase / 2-oxoglutarate reductase
VPFKVVFADTTAADYDVEKQIVAASGLDLDVGYFQTRDAAEVLRIAADADAVVMSWAPLNRTVIEGLARCRVISRYGIGVDMIDLDAATEQGIVVCNTARYAIEEVSAHTIALLLMLNRQMLAQIERVKSGAPLDAVPPPRRLTGQRLGLVGLGNIGLAVVPKARGLGLETVAFDPFLQRRQTEVAGTPLIELDELLRTSDFVSIHAPLNPSTHHLIGARELGLLKPSAYLINCARGAIVDQKALVAALAERRIAGVGLDVLEQEPLPADDPLRQFANAIITPHQAHWSVESALECRRTAVEHVLTFLKGGLPQDIVNRAVLDRGLKRS